MQIGLQKKVGSIVHHEHSPSLYWKNVCLEPTFNSKKSTLLPLSSEVCEFEKNNVCLFIWMLPLKKKCPVKFSKYVYSVNENLPVL